MRFVVIGAGAIGGLVGGLLHRGGSQVALVARGAHLEALQRDGLRLLTPWQDSTESIPAYGHVGELDWSDDDVVLLAVKSDATAGVLAELAVVAGPDTPIICLQNGVANEPTAQRWFTRVYGSCVMCPATHLDPGVVEGHSGPVAGMFDVGAHPGGTDEITAAFSAAAEASHLQAVQRPDIRRWKYRKLLGNLGNAVNACFVPGEGADRLTALARAEGADVLAAAGIEVTSEAEDADRRDGVMRMVPREGSRRGGSSSWQSLARGTGAIEADYLNGEIVWQAAQIARTAPVNDALRRVALGFAARRAEPQTLEPDDLLARLDADRSSS